MITLDYYQVQAGKTAIYPDTFTPAMVYGLCGYLTTAIDALATVDMGEIHDAVRAGIARVPQDYPNLVYPALGLAGEAGEIAEKVKKIIRDDGGEVSEEKRDLLIKELGDVLWYVAALATELGASLDKVAEQNLAKLASRAERGVIKGSGDNR